MALSQLLVDGGGPSHVNRRNVAVGYLKLVEYLFNRVNEKILKEQMSSVLCLMNMTVWVKDHVNDVSVSVYVLQRRYLMAVSLGASVFVRLKGR